VPLLNYLQHNCQFLSFYNEFEFHIFLIYPDMDSVHEGLNLTVHEAKQKVMKKLNCKYFPASYQQ
jgi:hypothetical protein